MKRQKYVNHSDFHNDDGGAFLPLQRVSHSQTPRYENTLEAQVQNGDTLQALALRFHCTVADIKRLNKIDKDNEIFARKIIKVPITPQSVLCETQPTVHRSGQNSPKHNGVNAATSAARTVLEETSLKEKLLVASVISGNANGHAPVLSTSESINEIILKSKRLNNLYTDNPGEGTSETHDPSSPLLDDLITNIRPIPGPSRNSFDCSGSDWDIPWIFLLILILALCFAIPLIYVFYATEHPDKLHHNDAR